MCEIKKRERERASEREKTCICEKDALCIECGNYPFLTDQKDPWEAKFLLLLRSVA